MSELTHEEMLTQEETNFVLDFLSRRCEVKVLQNSSGSWDVHLVIDGGYANESDALGVAAETRGRLPKSFRWQR